MNRHPLYLGRPVRLFFFLAAAFAVGMFVEKAGSLLTPYSYAPPGLEKTFAPFWETWDLVEKHPKAQQEYTEIERIADVVR